MNLKAYFSPDYLFQINSAYVSPKEKLFLFAGAVLVLLAVVLKIAAALAENPVDKRLRQKLFNLFLTFGLFELFWYLCRFEAVRFFGTHFMQWLIIVIAVVWFIAIIVWAIRNYGKQKEVWNKEQLKLKYLPK